MTSEQHKLFIRVMTSLFLVQQSMADLFLKNRLTEDIEHALEVHIKYWSHPSKESRYEHVRDLKDLGRTLEEITYLDKGDIIMIAITQEQVLRYLFNFIRDTKVIKEQKPTHAEIAVKTVEPVSPRPVVQNTLSVSKSRGGNKRLTETQEKILEFVRREPDCRTKDVLSQFSALSQRTVKRGLKELSEEGKIVKRADGVAVYYSAV